MAVIWSHDWYQYSAFVWGLSVCDGQILRGFTCCMLRFSVIDFTLEFQNHVTILLLWPILFFLYLWIFEVHVLSLLFLHYLLLHLWGFFFLLWSLCWLEGDSCIALKLHVLLLNCLIWCIYMYNILSIKPNWKPIKPLPLYGGSCCEETIE